MPVKTLHDEPPSINLTSLIDVLFLLIIFFMAGSSFQWEEHLPVALPHVPHSTGRDASRNGYVVYIDRQGSIWLGEQQVSPAELRDRLTALRANSKQLRVTIRGDAECPLQTLAVVLNACQTAGVDHTGLAVQPATVAGTPSERQWR